MRRGEVEAGSDGGCLGWGRRAQRGGGSRSVGHHLQLSPFAEVYLQGSFKPLVYISPSDR